MPRPVPARDSEEYVPDAAEDSASDGAEADSSRWASQSSADRARYEIFG